MVVFLKLILNSIFLFALMQFLSKPVSNLALGDSRYDTFAFNKDETTAGINIVYNILLSNIYMLVASEIVSDELKEKVYLIVVFYLIIRYVFLILILSRWSLLNIKYELTIILMTLVGTYLLYMNVINKGISILIPIEDFKNEIVLLIILFLFNVFQKSLTKIFSDRDNTSNRANYIRRKYTVFFDKYDDKINREIEKYEYFENRDSDKKMFKLFFYSIMVYEDFSRPVFFRKIENVSSQKSNRKMSTGIMQVMGYDSKSDEQSIEEAISILLPSFDEKFDSKFIYNFWIKDVTNDYNPQIDNADTYSKEINFIFIELKKITMT